MDPFWDGGGGGSVIGAAAGSLTCLAILSPREMRRCSRDFLQFVGYALYAAAVAFLGGAIVYERGT